MYVQKRSWLENGPKAAGAIAPRRRKSGCGLGDTVNLNAYGFIDPTMDQTGDCVLGADPSNPQCLSAAGLLAAAALGQKSPATNPAAGGLSMNYVLYGGVAVLVALAVARR